MYRHEATQAITAQRAFGIVRTATPGEAVTAAGTLLDAGLHAVEVALTTPQALRVLDELTAARPTALLGAGSVLDETAARAAIEAGARFLVSPSLHREVLRTGHRYGVPVFPGVGSPTEIVRALEDDADALKLFPASAVAPSWVTDVRAALPQAPLLPTGGVTVETAPEWIAAGAVACGLGSALTSGGPQAAGQRVAALLDALARAR